MRLDVIGAQRQRLAIFGNRLAQLPLALQGVAEVVVRLDVNRLDRQGAAVRVDGWLALPLGLERQPEAEKRLNGVGMQFDGALIRGGSLVKLAQRRENLAQAALIAPLIAINLGGARHRLPRRFQPAAL